MISNKDRVFKSYCSKYLQLRLTKFKDQVAFIESTLIELGLAPDKFNLGRDDSHQFFEFRVGTADEKKLELVQQNYDLLVNKANTPLVMSLVSYVCDHCDNLHLCFYIKALSRDNPFRSEDLERYLYYFEPKEIDLKH